MNPFSGGAPTLLIVDDEAFNLRVLKLKFENAGYKVVLAGNGKEGLKKFQSDSPDIVLTDINMPEMDGLEMGRQLPERDDYLLLIMTASLEVEARRLASDLPRAGFVQKPVSPRALLEKANDYLQKRRNAAGAHTGAHHSANGINETTKSNAENSNPTEGAPRQDNIATELAARYEELNLIYRIGKNLRLDEDVVTALTELVADSAETLQSDFSLISVKSRYASIQKAISANGAAFLNPSETDLLKVAIEQTLNTDRKSFTCNNSKKIPLLETLPAMQILVAPIFIASTGGCGFMAFIREISHNKFSTGDMRLLSVLSNHAAAITTNHNLYQDLKNMLLGVVESLGDTIEAKDPYTRGHTLMVSNHSVAIGKKMVFQTQKLEILRWAGLLHDIGKIGVPGHILNKPGKLTDEEMEIIKEHPRIGYEILKHIEPLKEALPAILHHHERMDGKGYPSGLKGDQIPLYGRIVSVADTYDSMSRDRPYRKGMPHDIVMTRMAQVAGTQLDQEIVNTFTQIIEKDSAIL